jgi:hypothetical protein
MKKHVLLFGLLTTISLVGCADLDDYKPIKDPNRPIEVIYELPGKTQAQIFSAAKSWLAESHLGEATDIDKDSGRIVSQGSVGNSLETDSYTLRIDAKNGKVKMTYTNFYFRQLYTSGGPSHAVLTTHDLNQATDIVKKISDKFYQYATSQATSNKW